MEGTFTAVEIGVGVGVGVGDGKVGLGAASFDNCAMIKPHELLLRKIENIQI